jgi:hypothetical protein|tara:strand:- start:393 stop:1025 length:633 start_codon:yes stop_codon:yes gene_type:complete
MIDLKLSSIYSYPLVDGKCVPDNLVAISEEILDRSAEVFPWSEELNNYDYMSGSWETYHDYTCIELFPNLSFMFNCIAESLDLIGDNYQDYYFKSWINVWPKGKTLNPHRHYGTWHGNYVIQDTGTETYYASSNDPFDRIITPIPNYNGHFIMMPGHILHWGQKNTSDTLRISSAFNLSTWDQVLQEEADDGNNRGSKVRDIVLPLKDYL